MQLHGRPEYDGVSQKRTFAALAARRRGNRRVRANECGARRWLAGAGPAVFSAQGPRSLAAPLNLEPYPLALLVIRRGFGCVALSLAQRNLLVLPSLFFLGPCACCPLSFSPVSTVVWLECHWILLCGGLISYLQTIYMYAFEFCLSLLFARLGLFPRQR
jgi:hypothetical protein